MRALCFLLWRDTLGRGRLLMRGLRSWRGVAMTGVFTLLAGSLIALPMVLPTPPAATAASHGFRAYAPLGLLALVSLGALAPRGLYFQQAEVAWLFPAPLRRRELVLYNVLSRARVTVLSALWLAAFPALRGRSFANALLGYVLSLLLLQISAQWFAVLRVWLGARAERRRRAAAIAVAGVGLAGLIDLVGGQGALLGSLVTRPFIEVVSAETGASALLWAMPCALLLAVLVASLCTLDVGYLEMAMGGSKGAEARRKRMRADGGVFAAGSARLRIRVPRFPRLRGAGPLAWRQCLEMVRNPRGVVLVLLVVMSGSAGVLLLPSLDAGNASVPPLLLPAIGAGMVFLASLMTGDNLAFDFRRDLDRMGALKALPISSFAIACGQIAAATFFVCVIQLIGISAIALGTGLFAHGAGYWLFLALLPPANWSAIAIDNVLFLLLPYRTVAEDPGDVSFLGRMMLSVVFKFAILALIAGAGAGVALAAFRASDGSLSVAAFAAFVLFLSACPPLTGLVAWAFRRFDVARDTPV